MMSNFDRLPDGVVCLIFSKLSCAQSVARCSMVCTRWRALCQYVDTLIFESFQLFENRAESKRKASSIEAIVTNMLLKTSGVRILKVSYHPVVWPWIHNDHFSEEKVSKWLEHVSDSLETLALVDPIIEKPQSNRLIHLSACQKLQWLNVCYGTIPEIPVQCRRFEHLKSCFFDLIAITDDALEAFVELCPVLEVLKLNSCTGLARPKINAPSLQRLDFVANLECVKSIQSVCANAPKLENVSLSYVKELITEGEHLYELELMCHVKPQIQGLCSLNSLCMYGHGWALESITEFVRLATSVRVLYIDVALEEKNPLRVDHFLGHLQDLTSLFIGSDFFECLQVGIRFTSALQWMNLPHLENLTAVVTCGNKHCIAVLDLFLNCAASLKALQISAGPLEKNSENMSFFSNVLRLQRKYPHVEINMTCPDSLL